MNSNTALLFILLGIGYCLTLLFIIAYEAKHIRNLKTNTFFLAKCAQAIAWFLLILRDGNLDYFAIVFANSLLFISYSLEVIAILSLNKPLTKKVKVSYILFTIFSIIGFHVIYAFFNTESIRITYYAIINAVIYLSIFKIIFERSSTLLLRLMGGLYVTFALISIFRGTISIISTNAAGSLFSDGNYQLFFLLIIFIFSGIGSIGFILLQREVVDKELIHFATYDDLTGALNRRTFTNQSQQILETCAKKNQPVSYLLFDIDNFKLINDTYGHQIGDFILQDLTEKIHTLLGPEDLLGRYGGDEFGILLPYKNEEQSTQIAKQIQLALINSKCHHLTSSYTISMGIITVIPNLHTKLDMLYKNCDQALYIAKHNGKNTFHRGDIVLSSQQ